MPHIVTAFDDDLISIRAKISEMGGISEEILANSLTSVRTRDPELAKQTIERDKRLDALEMELEEMATTTIALRQPMAQDLRTLLSAIKISATLERIGDLAKNVAKRAIIMAENRPIKLTSSIVHMGEQTQKQLADVLDAYSSRDTKMAVDVWNRDADLDETYNTIFRELMTYMMEDPRTIGVGSQLLFIAKNLERIGDHTTHISEKIHYIVEGTVLGDDRPKGEPLGLDLKA